MTPQEKTTLVVETIFDKLNGQQSGHLELTIANNASLNGKIFKAELDDILKNLQDKEYILEVLPDQSNKQIIGRIKTDEKTGKKTVMNVPPVMPTKKDYDFAIHVSPTFENWYSAYQKRINLKIEDLSEENFHKLFELTTLINNRFQMQGVPKTEFDTDTNYEDCLKFLYNKSIVHEFNVRARDGWNTYKIRYTLNVDKFVSFYSQIQKEFNKNFANRIDYPPVTHATETPDKNDKNKVLYNITFNMNNEIIINNDTIISKPNLNSENTDVFSYLFKNPNKKITKKEIEKHIEHSIGKDLHKIIENLGFTHDLRKTFFVVAKDAVIFRNPITKSTFDQLGITPLSIYKK